MGGLLMPDEKPKTPATSPPPVKPPAPNSWLGVIAGLTLCSAAAVLLAILLGQHLKMRPANLRDATLARAGEIQELLQVNLVGPEQMRQSEPRLVETDTASWYFTLFVMEAEGMDPDGLILMLDREMARGNVRVAEGEVANNVRLIDFFLGGINFAQIEFHLPLRHRQPRRAHPAVYRPVPLRHQAAG